VILIAALAIVGLFELRRWHRQAAHQAAAHVVAERGQWLAMNLALRVAAGAAEGEGMSWQGFSELLGSLREVEGDLEYVAVRREGATLFQEHVGGGRPGGEMTDYSFEGPVRIGRQNVTTGEGRIPVLSFTVTLAHPQQPPFELEVGLRHLALEREEWAAANAVESMYRLSLATMAACFGICLVLVAAMARREERREQTRRREEHLAFSGMLANGIVHDFRNPMSSLRLDAQMLAKESERGGEANPARMTELAGRMKHTLDRMDRVFQEFLTLARPGDTPSERLDLAACARECLEMLAPRLEAAKVSAVVEAPDGELWVVAPGPSVKRSLLNVLLNALQHAGEGGNIRVEGARTGRRARLDILDSGPGIPREHRKRIFDVFFTTRPQGTGLGLFLARTAIENHGGRLELIATGTAGAQFRMEFPLADKEQT
jgi:signal transduction histidine kinase